MSQKCEHKRTRLRDRGESVERRCRDCGVIQALQGPDKQQVKKE